MKMKELANKDTKELKLLLGEAQKELVNLRGQLAVRKLKNFQVINQKRKDIAQILTVLKQKESK
jgi:ribosomal protein L29